MIKLIGKVYILFRVKEFSVMKDFIKVKLSFSNLNKLFNSNVLSKIIKTKIIKVKLNKLKITILLEKLNISLEANEVI